VNLLRNAERGGSDIRDTKVIKGIGVSSKTEAWKQSNEDQRKQRKQSH
jgi:hypothetical protein